MNITTLGERNYKSLAHQMLYVHHSYMTGTVNVMQKINVILPVEKECLTI